MGNTLAVGNTFDSSGARGINENEADTSAVRSGAVYVYLRTGTEWRRQAYIKASNADQFDSFGSGLALSANGDTLVVGAEVEASSVTGVNGDQTDNSASMRGAVYVFSRSGSDWRQQAYLKASNLGVGEVYFGSSVALSADGNRVAISAPKEDSSATGINGNQVDTSAPNSGAVYLFIRSGLNWSQRAFVKAPNTGTDDSFASVALSADGKILAVGAIGEDSGATGINGNQADDSFNGAGAVYIY